MAFEIDGRQYANFAALVQANCDVARFNATLVEEIAGLRAELARLSAIEEAAAAAVRYPTTRDIQRARLAELKKALEARHGE